MRKAIFTRSAIAIVVFAACRTTSPPPQNFNEIDRLMASAADRVILSCERIVSRRQIAAMPPPIFIPGFKVAAVVEAPMGAHPGGFGDYYRNDDEHFAEYARLARDPARWEEYVARYVTGPASHEAYLESVGLERLFALRTGEGVAAL